VKNARRFFEYARARHQIYLDRAAGAPAPWTRDKILSKYRFTNVFRELDKTTAWFRKHVRDPMRDRPEVLLATVVFRLLNRIEVGEAIFCQTTIERGDLETAFDIYVEERDIRVLKQFIVKHIGKKGPYVTGAYIISSPPGYTKLDGVLEVIRRFEKNSDWRNAAAVLLSTRGDATLEKTWEYLKGQDYLGKFHSYEIVTDLRHTALLDRAPDIMTWCNIGPGARRGINRVAGRDYKDKSAGVDQMLGEMGDLLAHSRDHSLWPRQWQKWEMRDVEHTLCEFDKYERVRLGQGRPRGRFP
jgi:hypothetical protein